MSWYFKIFSFAVAVRRWFFLCEMKSCVLVQRSSKYRFWTGIIWFFRNNFHDHMMKYCERLICFVEFEVNIPETRFCNKPLNKVSGLVLRSVHWTKNVYISSIQLIFYANMNNYYKLRCLEIGEFPKRRHYITEHRILYSRFSNIMIILNIQSTLNTTTVWKTNMVY